LYGRTFFVALGLVGAIGTAVVYWLGGRAVLSGSLTIGTMVALSAYVVQVYQPLTALTNARIDLMTAFVSFERVFEVLDHPSPIVDSADAAPLRDVKGHIAFDHVSFRYPRAAEASIPSLSPPSSAPDAINEQVLHDISLTVEPGQLVALVGPSGAGKTTMAMLVPRLYDVTSGAVRVDGIDVRQVTIDSLRASIAIVSQDPHLFHDTIMANLRYAKPEAEMEEVESACRAARIADLIHSLPEGYLTVVGERGYRLSGGEKQRLALARLLLADPSIVILDEATAHLDSESEAHIQAALAEALAGRTSLVIAHRLSTIVRADRILVVDEGRIVEQGTHSELIALGGIYAELYDTQFNMTAA
jgi:ATP-binding cassette subfamily B protein